MAITNLKQNDPRWTNHPFAGETMGPAGCGPTAVADLLGHSTPVFVADWMQAHGYASNGSGTYHSGIVAALKAYGYSGVHLTANTGSLAGVMQHSLFEQFKQHIQNGNCGVILFGGQATGCRTSYWSRAGHYCACVGYKDGMYLIYDPAWSARDGYHGWNADIAGNVKHLFTSTVRWQKSGGITVDGQWGKKTTKLAQKVFGTTQDGIISNQWEGRRPYLQTCETSSWEFVPARKLKNGSELVRKIQQKIGATVDGFFGAETTNRFQAWLGVTVDGYVGTKTVMAFQHWLNNQ